MRSRVSVAERAGGAGQRMAVRRDAEGDALRDQPRERTRITVGQRADRRSLWCARARILRRRERRLAARSRRTARTRRRKTGVVALTATIARRSPTLASRAARPDRRARRRSRSADRLVRALASAATRSASRARLRLRSRPTRRRARAAARAISGTASPGALRCGDAITRRPLASVRSTARRQVHARRGALGRGRLFECMRARCAHAGEIFDRSCGSRASRYSRATACTLGGVTAR